MAFNLTIGIPTLTERAERFALLRDTLQSQIDSHGLQNKVELIHVCDDREMTIGAKRQRLYEMAQGLFCAQIDDDDQVHPQFIPIVNDCIEKHPQIDGIGYMEICNFDGQRYLAHHSDGWSGWGENVEVDGQKFAYARTLSFKTPVRTRICLEVGVNDLRFGEDRDFAYRLKASGLIKRSYQLPVVMYYYNYQSGTPAEKYGVSDTPD